VIGGTGQRLPAHPDAGDAPALGERMPASSELGRRGQHDLRSRLPNAAVITVASTARCIEDGHQYLAVADQVEVRVAGDLEDRAVECTAYRHRDVDDPGGMLMIQVRKVRLLQRERPASERRGTGMPGPFRRRWVLQPHTCRLGLIGGQAVGAH